METRAATFDGSFAQRGFKVPEWFVPFFQFIEGVISSVAHL